MEKERAREKARECKTLAKQLFPCPPFARLNSAVVENFSLHEFWGTERNCKITFWKFLRHSTLLSQEIPEHCSTKKRFFLKIFCCNIGWKRRKKNLLFSAGLLLFKRIEKTFCFSFLCQLTSMESVRTFDVPKRAMRSKTRKSDRSITTTMAQVLMSAKKCQKFKFFWGFWQI